MSEQKTKQEWHNFFDEFYDRRGTDCKKYTDRFDDDVLPMWIADTDFRVDPSVSKAARDRANHEAYGYPCYLPEFNTSVQGWMKRRHNWDISADAVEFATGVIPAEIFAIRALTHPGDRIVAQDPLYSPLKESVEDNGRQVVKNHLILEDGHYSIDFEDLDKKLSDPRTTMFLLCNPHNPTGRAFTREELEKIGELVLKHNVWVFADEVHSDLLYADNKHIPFANLSKEISDLTITGINPGKGFNVSGIRTAAVIIENKDLMNKYLISRKNNKGMGRTVFGQNVFIACYENGDEYIDAMMEYVENNVDYTEKYIKENIPEIKFTKPEATYLLWLDATELSLPQSELVELFSKDGKIGLNSGTDFGPGGEGHLRLNVAVPRVTLEEGLERIKTAVGIWKSRQ